MATRSPIVTAAELKDAAPSPRVFEVTWFPGASDPQTGVDFESGHIAGAVRALRPAFFPCQAFFP